MDMEGGPQDILDMIWCKCKINSITPYAASVYSCWKHALKYVSTCIDCQGNNCNIIFHVLFNEDDEVDYLEN